jgi:hypothetical protein
MKTTTSARQNGSDNLRPGNGYRTELSEEYIEFLERTAQEIKEAWDAANDPSELLDCLPWEDTATSQYGKAKWTSLVVDEDEVRISVQVKGDKMTVDYREFYTLHRGGKGRRS